MRWIRIAIFGIVLFLGAQYSHATDVSNFTVYNNGPVVITRQASGGWDDTCIREIGSVVYDASDIASRRYKLYFTGSDGTCSGAGTDVGVAFSPDGFTWTEYGSNPVIANAEDPYVILVGGTYYAYYENKSGGLLVYLSTSTDGVTFTPYGSNPVIPVGGVGTWDHVDTSSPTVYKEGATWYLFYEGRDSSNQGQVGLATSSDGLAWTKSPSNPVMSYTASAWDSYGVVPDDVVKVGSTYYMTYHGTDDDSDYSEGIASSPDLTTWTKGSTNPLYLYHPSFNNLIDVQMFTIGTHNYFMAGNDFGPIGTYPGTQIQLFEWGGANLYWGVSEVGVSKK